MAEDERLEDSVWAIVTTGGGRRYIGIVELNEVKKGTHEVHLNPAYELSSLTRPVQMPDGKVAINREVRVFPIDQCFGDVQLRIANPPELILMDEDLTKQDKEQYLNMVRMMQAELVAARAQRAGLELPQTRMPPGFDPKNLRGGRGGNS